MLGIQPFSHDLLRRYSLVFGTLFNEIEIVREDSAGKTDELIQVPLEYAVKQKVLERVYADPGIDRPASALLPRMSFELLDMRYNGANKLRSTGKNRVLRDGGSVRDVFNPVPYDLHFGLWVYAKYQSDANQILEQILPFFTPGFTASVNLIPEMDVAVDCPVVLNAVAREFQMAEEGKVEDHRVLLWRLDFTATAYLYGPVSTHPLIKFATVNFYDATTFDDIDGAVGEAPAIDRVTAQPGLTANGEPTTNAQLSVAYSQIDANSDWDYIVTISGELPGDDPGA